MHRRDLGSKNGTYIDGRIIGKLPMPVPHDARIGFGALAASISFRKGVSTSSLNVNVDELKRRADEELSTAPIRRPSGVR